MSERMSRLARRAQHGTGNYPHIMVCGEAADLFHREQILRARSQDVSLLESTIAGVAIAAVELLRVRQAHSRRCAVCLATEAAGNEVAA